MNAWIDQIFASKIAKRGGMARRKVASVQKHVSAKELEAEVKQRGFHHRP